MFVGIVGGSTAGICEQISGFLSRLGFANVRNGSDAMNAVAASLGESDGITVIMGTGSVTFAQANGGMGCLSYKDNILKREKLYYQSINIGHLKN